MKIRAWIWITASLLVLILVAAFISSNLRPYLYHGSFIESQEVAPDIRLTTQHGQTARLSDFRGKLVVLYFGYTFCPDVCPATLAEVNNALEQLGEKADEIQVIMVTVDPERDTTKTLAEYLAHFNPDFLGLTGSPDEIAQAASAYGVYYEKSEGTAATKYLVDHTASLFVIDQQGYLKLILPFGTSSEDMAGDFAQLMK